MPIRSEQDRRTGNSLEEFQRDLAANLVYERGTTAESASALDAYWTLAVTIRDRLADRRARTARANYVANPKFVYYLSAEYMLGRQLRQNAVYTGTDVLARRAVAASGFSAWDLESLDVEPGLGNGGLGRLAACLLDSLATLDMPAVGYGIRYEFGIFKQTFEDGYQVEQPDDWTFYGNPWEFPAPDDLQVVGFYGHTEPADDDQGRAAGPLGAGRNGAGRTQPHARPGLRHRDGQHPPAVARPGRPGVIRPGPLQRRPLRRGRRGADALGEPHQGALPERQHGSGPGAAAQAAVFPGLLLAAGHNPPVPVPQQRLGDFPRQGGHPAQRHPSGAGNTRAHAAARGRARGRLGPGLVHHPPHLRLHLPHPAARSPGDLAGAHVRAAATAPSGDHLRPQ